MGIRNHHLVSFVHPSYSGHRWYTAIVLGFDRILGLDSGRILVLDPVPTRLRLQFHVHAHAHVRVRVRVPDYDHHDYASHFSNTQPEHAPPFSSNPTPTPIVCHDEYESETDGFVHEYEYEVGVEIGWRNKSTHNFDLVRRFEKDKGVLGSDTVEPVLGIPVGVALDTKQVGLVFELDTSASVLGSEIVAFAFAFAFDTALHLVAALASASGTALYPAVAAAATVEQLVVVDKVDHQVHKLELEVGIEIGNT